MRARCVPRCCGRAFTIVELLVIVTIIVALLAILLPSMARAVAYAEIAICQSNLRQIGTGTIAYTQDNFGMLPHCQDWAADIRDWGAWHRPIGTPDRIAPSPLGPGGLIFKYMQDADVYVCPTFVAHAAAVIPAGDRVVWTYAMFEAIRWMGDWHGLAIRDITDAKLQPGLQGIIAEESPFVPTTVASYQLNNSAWGVSRDPNPAAKIDAAGTYHLSDDPTLMTGQGNVLYLDGHAELRLMKESVDPKIVAWPADFPPSQWSN